MSWCSPNWEAMPSILEPSFVALSFFYKRFDLTLNSSRATVEKGLFAEIVSRFS